MTEGIWIALVGILAVPLGVWITWVVNRKRNVADIYTAITEGSQNAVETMHDAMDALNIELAKANSKIDRLEKEMINIRHQNDLLIKENHALHRRVNELLERMAAFDPSFESNDSSHT